MAGILRDWVCGISYIDISGEYKAYGRYLFGIDSCMILLWKEVHRYFKKMNGGGYGFLPMINLNVVFLELSWVDFGGTYM